MYSLPKILFLKIRFVLTALQDTYLPRNKGSMLRGAFGHALKKTVCVMPPKQTCKTCMLRNQCVFTKIFDVYIKDEPPPFLKGIAEAPKPFIIDCHHQQTHLQKGENLDFMLTLIGNACDYYPYIIFAVSRMAETGFTVHKSPFLCSEAYWYKQHDYDFEERLLYRGTDQHLCENADLSVTGLGNGFSEKMNLSFLTPTRIKFQSQYSMEFNFRMLVFKILRRHLELAHFYVPDEQPNWEFYNFLKLANDIKVVDKKLHWEDWRRFSSRQQAQMDIGGFIGNISLEGDLKPFSELLNAAKVLHVGKGTSFGLGKVSCTKQ